MIHEWERKDPLTMKMALAPAQSDLADVEERGMNLDANIDKEGVVSIGVHDL